MGETGKTKKDEKAVKIQRKPELGSALSPTFSAARQVSGSSRSQAQRSGKGLLQRQGASPGLPEETGETSSPPVQISPDRPRSAEFSAVPPRTAAPAPKLVVQPSLTVNEPGDPYEQEADRVADTVMRMPAAPTSHPWLGRAATSGLSVNRWPLISRLHPEGGRGPFQAPAQVEARISQMQGGGEALPESEREFFETRMGYDFSGVRVHTGSNAVQASRDIQARAFTIGSNIAFNQGAYQPGTEAGRRLLAHELAHAAQQGGVMRKEEDSPAGPAGSAGSAGYRSPALALRAVLNGSLARLVLQRSVTTSGGVWDTDKYDLAKDKAGDGSPLAPSVGMRGVDIELKFTPAAVVDAELIGVTQSVQAVINNAPNLTPAAATRAIPAASAQGINTGTGETDVGTAIDRAAGYNNPIYPVASTASTSLADTNTSPGWGQNGWRYTDAAGTLQTQDAKLIDAPRRANAATNARHIFEATATATKGTQAGVYYGSVRWGWRTDSTGDFTKLPLEVVSQGVPSSTFMKAAQIWNQGKSSTGAANVNLPIVDVKVNDAPLTLTPAAPAQPVSLPAGSRLQVLEEWHPPLLSGRVVVVDGPQTGVMGTVDAADWGKIKDERA